MKEKETIRPDEKTVKKMAGKMILAAVCSILLCVACLAGPAWAWYTAYIENPKNIIQIGEPVVAVAINGDDVDGEGVELSIPVTLYDEDYRAGHRMSITNAGHQDSFFRNSTIYLTISVDEKECGYVSLRQNVEIILYVRAECKLSWTASWQAPDYEEGLTDVENVIGFEVVETVEETTEPTVETTAPTEATVAPTESTTEPTGSTQPTGGNDDPADETTQPTGGSDDPADETTGSSTDATENAAQEQEETEGSDAETEGV